MDTKPTPKHLSGRTVELDLRQPADAGGRRPHVLVVDDDPAMRLVMHNILTQQGYRVTTAASAAAALNMFDLQGADLIILDVKMPDMDGFEVCRIVQSTGDVPVIMLTGATNQSVRERLPQLADGAGARAYLRKPLNVSELKRQVDGFLRQ